MCEYKNDGQAVFEKRSKREAFFLYFRGDASQWVIDTIITPSGAVFARNDTPGVALSGAWMMRGDWEVDHSMKVNLKKHPKGHNGEAVEITGGKEALELQGVYLRQPDYDDINGHPHYVLPLDENTGHDTRRRYPPRL